MIIEEIIQYEPFKTLWRRNKRAEGKGMAIMDCEYVYYMYSFRSDNPYRVLPEPKRMEELKEVIYKGKYREDPVIIWALEKWKMMNNTTDNKLLTTAMTVAEKLVDHLNKIDWESRSIKVGEILNDLENISKAKGILDQLKKFKAAADANMDQQLGRGQQEISDFQDASIYDQYVSKPED